MPFDEKLLPHEVDARVAKYLLNKITSSRDRQIPFELTFIEVKNLMQTERCYYTGITLTMTQPGQAQKLTDFTIDRIDNNLGYVTGNVVACCHAANSFKGMIEGMTDTLSLEQKASILMVTVMKIRAQQAQKELSF